MDAAGAAALLAEVEPEAAAGVLRRLAPAVGATVLARLEREPAVALLRVLPPEIVSLMLRRLAQGPRESLLDALPRRHSTPVRRLLRHPPDTAGSLMDPRVAGLPRDLPVNRVIDRLREEPQHAVYYLYVVDRGHQLVGVLNLRELLVAPPDALLGAVMVSPVARLRARAGLPAIVRHPSWLVYHALPVVDDRGVYLGAIRYETIRSLERAAAAAGSQPDYVTTALNVAELFWVGFAGMVGGLGGPALALRRPERTEGEHGG